MLISQTLNFVILHDCLEDATFAIEAGNSHQAVAYLEAARQRLKDLVIELVAARSQIEELESLLSPEEAKSSGLEKLRNEYSSVPIA